MAENKNEKADSASTHSKGYELLGIPEEDRSAIIAKMGQKNQHDAAKAVAFVPSEYVLRSRGKRLLF